MNDSRPLVAMLSDSDKVLWITVQKWMPSRRPVVLYVLDRDHESLPRPLLRHTSRPPSFGNVTYALLPRISILHPSVPPFVHLHELLSWRKP